MRALGCGAEPIQADVLRAFMDKFAPRRPQAHREHPALVRHGRGHARDHLLRPRRARCRPTASIRKPLMAGRASAATNGHVDGDRLAAGAPFPGAPGRDPRRRRAKRSASAHVGEIVARGPERRRAATSATTRPPTATFGGGRLFTGDLGYFADGELYVCGRSKDLIILAAGTTTRRTSRAIISRGRRRARPRRCAVFTCPRAQNGTAGTAHDVARRAPDRGGRGQQGAVRRGRRPPGDRRRGARSRWASGSTKCTSSGAGRCPRHRAAKCAAREKRRDASSTGGTRSPCAHRCSEE